MGVYIWSKLPSEYQEVEYIQSTGTQWINTGLGVNQNTIIECKVNMQPGATYQYPRVYGVRNSGTGGLHFGLQWDRDNKYFYAVNYSNDGDRAHNIQTGTLEYNTDYTIKQTNTQLRINGVLQGTVSASTYSISYPLWLFNDEQAGSDFDRKANMKLYRLKMYSGTTLQRDFVPCYRKSDGVIGLYDLVNNQFYTNSGSGTFSKGNDVTMTELKNAYIGEVYEYEYDFRNKSSSQLNTDGWSVFAGSLETGSNGITSPIGYDVTLMKTGLDLSTASKITISTNIVWNRNDTNGSRAALFGLINPATQWNNQCVFYVASAAAYNGTRAQLTKSGTLIQGTNIGDIGTGTYTPILEIDLTNKTLTGKISGYNNSIYTLTDELVSFIRQLSGIYVYTTQHNYYIQNVSITIE